MPPKRETANDVFDAFLGQAPEPGPGRQVRRRATTGRNQITPEQKAERLRKRREKYAQSKGATYKPRRGYTTRNPNRTAEEKRALYNRTRRENARAKKAAASAASAAAASAASAAAASAARPRTKKEMREERRVN